MLLQFKFKEDTNMAGLYINHNLMALTASRNLGVSYSKLSSSINKLSSGLRINSSADDAAGLAVRELMRSDIAVLNQGQRNANDAISMLQTMDGAAGVIDEKLIRMKELAEQAATGTYNDTQRGIMNDEFSQMRSEIERIAQATEFNGVKMLNATSGGTAEVIGQAGAVAASNLSQSASTYFANFASATGSVTVQVTKHDGTVATSVFAFSAGTTNLSSVADWINLLSPATGSVSGGVFQITDASAGTSSLDVQLFQGSAAYHFSTVEAGTAGQVKIHFGTGNDSAEDYYYVNKQDMTATGLGINAMNISTQHSAQGALTTIDAAILTKDQARAHFGAMMNRLSNTVSNLSIQAENVQAAESQISDVDVATEMTKFVNSQIKSQAAVAMLAQANTLPQMALSLISGR
jgi:flagellin